METFDKRMGRGEYMVMKKKYMRTWIFKSFFIIKNTVVKWREMIQSILSILGSVLVLAEAVMWMLDTEIIYEKMHKYAILCICGCVIIAFFINKVKLKYEYMINGTDVKITLQVTDVLKNTGTIVIPTNTTFDTLMEDEFISVNSVQGQFQERFFQNNLKTLDTLIEKGLCGIDFEILDRKGSKQKRYPVGTISKVTCRGCHYYFVAIADVNEYGKPENTDFENIRTVLSSLWNQMEIRGNLEDVAIPLIGTGRAGIRNVTREKVVKEIINSFMESSKQRKVTENLIICVHPFDLREKDMDIYELSEYLKYKCKYGEIFK